MDRTFKRERTDTIKLGSRAGKGRESYEDLQIGGIREELERVRYNHRFWLTLYTIAGALVVGLALVLLVTKLWMPVVRVADNQMAPAVEQGKLVVARRAHQYRQGDIIAFYNGRKILVRRIIACENEWVNIAGDGTVFVNDIALEESYIHEKVQGNCTINMPCRVPRGSFFVMSDNRSEALDSRDSSVGCVSEGQIIGRIRR